MHIFHRILTDKLSSEFNSSYIFDIRETTDDRPFFHYFLRPSKAIDIYEFSGRKWAYFLHEGMLLPFILLFLLIIAICIFGTAFILSRNLGSKLETRNLRLVTGSLVYFTLIGFAFMFVEVFFIHRLILTFGSPMKALSLTLVIILISAGFGSLTTGWLVWKKMIWIISLAPLFIIANYFVFDMADENVLSAFLIVPIGMVLGFFFPAGLRFLVSYETGGVPLAYAANGAASIIAPSLASLVAVSYGCNVLLVLAAILYALAIAVISIIVLRTARASGYS